MADVTIHRAVDYRELRQPDLGSVLGEDAWWLPYRDYWSTFGATFQEASASLIWERGLIESLPTRSAEAENQLLDEVSDALAEWPNWGLDLGIGCVVLALSAAGCATLVSCSGHFGEGHWSSYPMVQFAADEARCRLLLDAAERANCGLANCTEGLVKTWAAKIEVMMEFAGNVISLEEGFTQLPPAITPTDSAGAEIDRSVQAPDPNQGSLFS